MTTKNPIQCQYSLLDYLNQYVETTMQSQFSYIGYLNQGVMYFIYDDQCCYLKSAPKIQTALEKHHCKNYSLKKHMALVNLDYYDISYFIKTNDSIVGQWIEESINNAHRKKESDKQVTKKIRQLPNISPSITRLLAQAQITNVNEFKTLGATKCFLKLKESHGHSEISDQIFWALVGAQLNCFKANISEKKRRQFLRELRSFN